MGETETETDKNKDRDSDREGRIERLIFRLAG